MIKDTSLTPEDFKNIAQGIQAILISVAAILGAWWAITKFNLTNEIKKSQLELDKLKFETSTIRGIESNFSIQHFVNSKAGYDLYIKLDLLNLAPFLRTLNTGLESLMIARIEQDKKENKYFKIGKTASFQCSVKGNVGATFYEDLVLTPDTKSTLYFYYNVKEKGTYMITFRAKANQMEFKSEKDIKTFSNLLSKYKSDSIFITRTIIYHVN